VLTRTLQVCVYTYLVPLLGNGRSSMRVGIA
jgi:hypothetical protein